MSLEKQYFLTRASLPPFDEYIEEIKGCWGNRWITSMGPKHNQLEAEIKAFLNVQNAKLFANGHSALETTIQAFNLEGEVITTPFTFASTTHAIVRNGLIPRFCDIKLIDFNIDADKIESLITPKTSAIIPVHLFGNPCDVERIEEIAKRHNLAVIYDAAHAFGVEKNGKSIASYGDASVFSFHASKVFNTVEGGAVVYKNSLLSDVLDKLRVFGANSDEQIEYVSANGKMNELEAAMGICNLRHFAETIESRRKAVLRYNHNLSSVKGIDFPKNTEGSTQNYCYFPIIIRDDFKIDRDEAFRRLHSKGILARKHFGQLASHYPCYPASYSNDKTSNAEYVSNHIISLPLYVGLENDDIDYICEVLLGR